MAYPSSADSFTTSSGTNTLSSPDHNSDHQAIRSAIVAVETLLGTNSGTSVLKGFTAGKFPAIVNASGATGTLQQTLTGTLTSTLINNSTLGTPAITGGTANNQTLGTPAITGGTANNQTLGTPVVTGGTFTSPTINTSVLGNAIATGANITTGTNNALIVTPKGLADATVGKLGAAWTAFTPSWTNLTVGAGGTNTGSYTQIGKTVFFYTYFKFGTGSAVGTNPTLTLPVAGKNNSAAIIGQVQLEDSGSGLFLGVIDNVGVLNSLITNGQRSQISATAPWTWATNDTIMITGTYEAA